MGKITDNVMGVYNPDLQNTKIADFPRYDFVKPVKPQARYLTPVAWALSFPDVWKHKAKITRDLQGVKPPYIMLCNHNSFLDFKIMTAALFPRRANYVVALDGFIGREAIMRMVGCLSKRKFVNDIDLIRQTSRLLDQGQIVVYYPEARYSHIGTNSVLPESLGKMLKYLQVPVVSLLFHGHHIDEPAWNQVSRGTPVEAEMKLLLTKEQVAKLSPAEIQAKTTESLVFDDYAWQYENQVRVTYPQRAEGLHRVLYQCPNCKAEYRMHSQDSQLSCSACGKVWELTEYGQLQALQGETEFRSPPAWYEWQRENVRAEVRAGTYAMESEVLIDSLPNSKGFVQLGKGWRSGEVKKGDVLAVARV
ncbi:MAG: 1-acyl-sn-glycerol-3-phosphate acyltransferase, partial [Anaerolineaceae bacterium]|nr:1-acyl-sn-glycerol-3-phosphate acyltransferase [Anaerolineaceae bacterium]